MNITVTYHTKLLKMAFGSMVASVLVGCTAIGASEPNNTSALPASTKPFDGATITMLMEELSETQYIQDLLPEFKSATGITVQFENVPYGDMYTKLITQLTSGDKQGAYDAVYTDFYWTGEFARSGWIKPLDDQIAADKVDLSGIIPALFDINGKVDGQIYYIPVYPYPMGIVYRTDLGITIPKTMEELAAYAKGLKKSDFFGVAMQGAPTDPVAMEWLNFLYALGGDLYEKDGKTPRVNDAIGQKALSLYIDMIDNAAQTGAAGANLDDASAIFAQGKSAMMVTYITIFSGVFQDPEKSTVVDKWAVAPMPGTGVGNVGAWSFGIPTSSKNPGAAWEFIKWVTSEKVAKARALEGGSPAYTSFFTAPELIAKYPNLPQAYAVLKAGKGLPLITKQQDMVATLGRELSEAVTKRKTPQKALDDLAAKLKELANP